MLRCRWMGVALVLGSAAGFAQQPQQPKGVPARSSASDYQVRATVDGVTYAASLVPASEVKHLFAFDVSKNYVVFEVALYPSAGAPRVTIDPDGFVARTLQSGDPVRRADSLMVASVIQQKNTPPPQARHGSVMAATEIGYESGRDPYTGRRVHGTYTDTQVGVTNQDAGPPPMPSPGGYPQDRDMLESQLWHESLPAGELRAPSAGYLYFPKSLLKKKSNDEYRLEYLGADQQPVLNGAVSSHKVELQIPGKAR